MSDSVFYAGIDIGSTTVKLVIRDDNENTVFSSYLRHMARIKETLSELLTQAHEKIGDAKLKISMTGSGAIGLAKALDIDFVQEVVSVAKALTAFYPQTDVAVELGGEDAKIIYFKGGLEERMNGVCAGGTGSFIDQMAALLQTDSPGLNELAKQYEHIYPIASRCGVFAKSDIQPLINDGVSRADIAASVLQAVVNQTISGLACGKPIRGHIAFLGGPLHFLSELKKAFIKTLQLTPDEIIDPENSHLFAAFGASMTQNGTEITFEEFIKRLNNHKKLEIEAKRLSPLFENDKDFDEFLKRHEKAKVKRADISSYSGNCYLGIDAGSTTTKLVLIGENGELLFSDYRNNSGDPIKTAMAAVDRLSTVLPKNAKIVRSCSTGYGEALLKSAFNLDDGEVETIAHATAAAFFDPKVDCVLDIGGQDMKCIRLKNGNVDSIMLNEACSSGCGSFIENFAVSLGLTAEKFAAEAIKAKAPVDLGTRCTVFMNSNVKQAQKEGAPVSDISAGLAYSVIKNALYKVIKLADANQLGSHIVVQGGTFYNNAVLRALEKLIDKDVICPDICGLMGAFGAALLAKERYDGSESSILPFEAIKNLEYHGTATRCGGCENNCLLTVNKFSGGKTFITGNRCEKKFGNKGTKKGVNLFDYKNERLFGYELLSPEKATRGEIGIPRVLNLFENYPFWATFFTNLGFRVVLSPFSSRKIYQLGMESIPSESECYPAKLVHGHIKWLIDSDVKTIFHPSVYYEYKETESTKNHYNCPMVISYPENIKNNMEELADGKIRYIHPFITFSSEEQIIKRMTAVCKEEWNIPASEVKRAAHIAWIEQGRFKDDVRSEGKRILDEMAKKGEKGIVLAGRPYHLDPEINHGIPEMIASYGLNVFTEDSVPFVDNDNPVRVLNQWTFHARLYNAAEYVASNENLQLVQLNSFGCGLDAVTTDQVCEILEDAEKPYTVLKIDEVNNLGAARIRIRSLLAAINMKKNQCTRTEPYNYQRTEFTEEMYKQNYTILAPDMSPFHFHLIEPIFHRYGYNVKVIDDTSKNVVDMGLKYVNNDACYPSIITIGQLMSEVLSGKYDTNKLALMMSQTGGCCRASNYVGFIRRALDMAGLSHIPVISLSEGVEKNSGFNINLTMLADGMRALIWGDLLMRCVYRIRPYELEKGSTDKLHEKWQKLCIEKLSGRSNMSDNDICRGIVNDFDNLPIDENLKKPRVGIVGEILVKYMPLANNDLAVLLEKEGAEPVVPDLIDFLAMYLYNKQFKHKYLGIGMAQNLISKIGIPALERIRKPATDALRKSKRFTAPNDIRDIAEGTTPFLSLGNQYGEGWFLCGEMVELINNGVPNIVCVQPFACLPNHVVGKGVIKALKNVYPESNIAAVDYDPGASEVNQLNRIKLMLSVAKDNLNKNK